MNILVVVDMQNDFLTGSLANPDAVKIIPGIVEEILSGKYDHIYATCDMHGKNYLDTIEGKHLPIPHCELGSWGEDFPPEINKALGKQANVSCITKTTFGEPYLATRIEKRYERSEDKELSITLVGTCTDICVISNALILKTIPYAEVSVIEHLCAGTTPENHENAIKAMRQCHVNIL